MMTVSGKPSAAWSRMATYPWMTPAASSRRTLVQHGDGESPTSSANSALVSLARPCRARRIRRSMASMGPPPAEASSAFSALHKKIRKHTLERGGYLTDDGWTVGGSWHGQHQAAGGHARPALGSQGAGDAAHRH